MTDNEHTPIIEKIKKPLYVGLGAGAALGFGRAVSYIRNWYAEHKKREREEIAALIRKYKTNGEGGLE